MPVEVRAGSHKSVFDTAKRQHGVITRAQLIATGMSDSTLGRKTSEGMFERVYRGVYRVAGTPIDLKAKTMAAVLSMNSLAAASHGTAAWLHDLQGPPDSVEVVATRPGRRHRDFAVHQSTDLEESHITEVDGIPTTNVARTIVDIGIPHGIGVAGRTLDEARRRGLVDLETVAELRRQVARKGRNGVGPARLVIAQRSEWDQVTESALEDRFIRLVQSYGLPEPEAQHRILNHRGAVVARVDFAYPDQNLAIELDGAAFHSDKEAFQRDRVRQNELVLQGWTVVRFTYWDLRAGDRVLNTLRVALGL